MITRERFIEATRREPEQDDLDRCNCLLAGTIGHSSCGWDERFDLPEFDAIGVRQFLGWKPVIKPLRQPLDET